jgi:hypothetical protein
VTYVVKYTWPSGNQYEKENQVILVQTLAIGLSTQNNWGQGTKVCIVRQSQSQVRPGWSFSWFLFGRGSRVVIWRVLHPEKSLLLGIVLVPCHKDVIDYFCLFLIPRWL